MKSPELYHALNGSPVKITGNLEDRMLRACLNLGAATKPITSVDSVRMAYALAFDSDLAQALLSPEDYAHFYRIIQAAQASYKAMFTIPRVNTKLLEILHGTSF